MSYTDKRKQADLLQQKISAHGELSADVKKKINYKFRLDWNYYSNSMEGNTLTMDETRSVMVGNLTVGGKPIKDVLEMKGHDEVIMEILKIGKGEMRLSEQRIKEIHRGIMHEEDESKRPKIGEWKTEPNYIYNYKNERFDFVQPAEVPERMHQLLNKTNAAIDAIRANKKDAPHPLDVALQFHLEYVVIHPFYDGNGRTARILTNLLLISFGYPPFWVKTNERSIYNQYIGDIQGYGGNPDLFYEFAATMIIRSQQLVLDAIEGKDIQELDDIDKEIALWKKNEMTKKPIALQRNDELVYEVFTNGIKDLFASFEQKHQQFFTLFSSHEVKYYEGIAFMNFGNLEWLEDELGKTLDTHPIFYNEGEAPEPIVPKDSFVKISAHIQLSEYLFNTNSFSVLSELSVYFQPFFYEISYESKVLTKKTYSEFLSQDEVNSLIKTIVSQVFQSIKAKNK